MKKSESGKHSFLNERSLPKDKESSAGSNPARSVLREPRLVSVKERIFKTVWELRKEGYAKATVEGYDAKLKVLSKIADLQSPEMVKGVVAEKQCSTGFKEALVNAYDHYVRVNGLAWEKPFYPRQRGLPYIASPEQISQIIARASRRYALVFSILRDTGMRPVELNALTLRSIDLEKGSVTVRSAKGARARLISFENYWNFPDQSLRHCYLLVESSYMCLLCLARWQTALLASLGVWREPNVLALSKEQYHPFLS